MRSNIATLLSVVTLCCTACNTDTITVTYNGDKAEVSPNDFEDVEITVKGSDVKVKNTSKEHELTFVLKGKSNDGSFTLKTDNKAKIKLDGIDLTSQEGAPLHIKNKGHKLELCAADGTDNSLTITACKDTAKHKAAVIFAKDDLTFTGKGTLNVLATGDGCKGINVKEKIEINDLTLNVSTTGMYLGEDTTRRGGMPFDPNNIPEDVKKHMEEMKAKFEEMQKNGTLPPMMGPGKPMGMPGGMPPTDGEMPMGNPPMKHNYTGTTKGIKSNKTVTINSGKVKVTTESGGAEGIEGKKGVIINGGEVYIKSNDDAINANAQIFFNGGDVTAISLNNDAVDSNLEGGFPPFPGMDDDKKNTEPQKSAIIINGGTIRAWSQAGGPEEGLDCDFSPIEVTGGTVLSIGAGMGEMPSVPTQETAKQPTILVIGLKVVNGTTVELYEADAKGKATGTALASFTPTIDFANSSSIITSPSLKVGKKYCIKSGSQTKTFDMKDKFTIVR